MVVWHPRNQNMAKKACADFDWIHQKIYITSDHVRRQELRLNTYRFISFPSFDEPFDKPFDLHTWLLSFAGQSRHPRMRCHLTSRGTLSKVSRATPWTNHTLAFWTGCHVRWRITEISTTHFGSEFLAMGEINALCFVLITRTPLTFVSRWAQGKSKRCIYIDDGTRPRNYCYLSL